MPPEVSFTALIISMASTAAVHFGDLGDPVTGQKQPPNMMAARHAIDLLSLLEEKTRGNLTDEEAQTLKQVLVELRMRFVQLATGKS